MTDLLPDLAPAPVQPSTLPSPAPDNPEEALSWLGGTVEEVAEGLRARGIKGTQKEAHACPVSNYLGVWWEDVTVWQHVSVSDTNKGFYWNQDTPPHIFQFALDFDDGAFPDLIAD